MKIFEACLAGFIFFVVVAQMPLHAALSLAVSANPNPARSGETVNVAYTVMNTAQVSVSNLSLETLLPIGVNAIHPESLISHRGDCPGVSCENGDRIRWNLGTLAAGEGRTVSFPAVVATGIYTPADGTVITFAGAVMQNATALASASTSVVVASEPVFDLALIADANPVAVAGLLSFELSFGNRSDVVLAQSTVLSIAIPSGTAFISAEAGGVLSNSVVTWPLGDISPGAWGRRQLQVQVRTEGLIHAQATISDGLNTSESSRLVRAGSALSLGLSITANPQPVRAGEMLRVVYRVANLSDTPRTDVVLQARVPDELRSINPSSLLSHGGECSDASCDPKEFITWSIGDLAVAEVVRVTAPFVPSTGAALSADGTLIFFDAFVNDGAGRDAQASLSVPIKAEPVLALSIVPSRDPVRRGELLDYSLMFANRSSAAWAPDVRLSMPVPEGTRFVAAQGDHTLSDGAVTWAIGDLDAGDWGRRQLQLEVIDGDFIPAAAVIFDAVNAASASVAVRVTEPPPLTLSINASTTPVHSGQMASLFYTVANVSDSIRRDVVLRARVPNDVQSVNPESLISHGGDCTDTSCDPRELIVWSWAELAVGEAVTVSVPFVPSTDADTPAAGTIIPFTARLTDETGVDVRAKLSVAVASDPILTLALMADADPVAVGDLLTYSLSFGNRAATALVQDTQLSMAIPEGTTFVAADGNGVESNAGVTWALGDWRAGQASERQLQVRVNALPEERVINAEARFNEVRAAVATRRHSDAALNLSLSASVNSARSGDIFDISLNLSNTSGITRNNVVVLVRVPEGIGSVFESLLAGGRCLQPECNARDYITWEIAALSVDESVSLSFPAVIATGADAPPEGTVISFNAEIFDDADGHAYAMDRVLVGNSSPVANPDQLVTNENISLIGIDLLSNDSDADGDSLSLASVAASSVHGGRVAINNAGRLVYIPAENFSGSDSFHYMLSDGKGGLDQGWVTVTVTAKSKSGGGGVFVYLFLIVAWVLMKRRGQILTPSF